MIRNKPRSGLNGSSLRDNCCCNLCHGCGNKEKGPFSYFQCSYRHLSQILCCASMPKSFQRVLKENLLALVSVGVNIRVMQLLGNAVLFLHQKGKLFTSVTFFGTLSPFPCRRRQAELAGWFLINSWIC